MNHFKRILTLCMVAIFVLAPVIHASNSTYVYVSNNVEVKITHSGLTEEKLIYIAQTLASGQTNSGAQTYGLTCTLFGHKLVSTISEVTTHMVYETYPYCECKTYESNVCERCDYMETELLVTQPVGCCTK